MKCSFYFPNKKLREEESKPSLLRFLKGNCPCCITEPIEQLSEVDYRIKYAPKHTLVFGNQEIDICEYHLRELYEKLKEEFKNENF